MENALLPKEKIESCIQDIDLWMSVNAQIK